jgi:hypothetical protein
MTGEDVRESGPSWLGPALWAALLRHSIPVLGVLVLGWSPLEFLVFVVLETWLFLTLRTGVEATLNRSFGPVPQTLPGTLAQMAFLTGLCGAALAIVLGLVSVVVLQSAFSPADWERFRQAAVWSTPGFRVALLLLLVDHAWDAGRFAMRIAPLPAPDQLDDLHLQRMVLRVVFLAAAGFAAGLSPARGAGGRAVVIALALAMVLLEAWPQERAAAPAAEGGSPTASAAAAAAPRRSRRRRGRSPRG